MTIRKLQKGDEEILENFLSAYAETSMFLRSNLRTSGLVYKDESFHGEYFGSFNNIGEVNGVIAHYWNGNIMVQAIDNDTLNKLINVLRKNISRSIAGVVGSSKQSEVVITGLGLSDANFVLNRDEGLYALDLNELTIPSSFEAKRYRMVDVAEIERSILSQWLKAYEIEAFGLEDDETLDASIQNRVDETIKNGDCWVLLVDNQPVSLSGFNARLPDIVQVGPVWTPPKFRNNGYARTVVALTLEKAKQENVIKSILFTDNPAAIKSYEYIGFKKVNTYRLAILKDPVKIN